MARALTQSASAPSLLWVVLSVPSRSPEPSITLSASLRLCAWLETGSAGLESKTEPEGEDRGNSSPGSPGTLRAKPGSAHSPPGAP